MLIAGITGRKLIVASTLLLAGTLLFAQTSPSKTAKKSTHKHSAAAAKKSKKAHSHKGKRSRKASWRRGQQKPDTERTRQIQQALIREHYLDGEPTGVWDQKSQRAMEKYQADNGWQTKTIPDARALIKLGLGPNHDHLLNPESAMTGPLETSRTAVRPVSAPATTAADPSRTNSQPQK